MTTPNPNVDVLATAYRRWAESRGRSVEDWVAIASPDFVVRSAADEHAEGAFGDVPAGHDGLRLYLLEMVSHWIMESYEVRRLIADGDDAVAVIDTAWRHRVTNKRVACALVDVWTFKDGLATSVLEVFDTAAMVEAARPDAA